MKDKNSSNNKNNENLLSEERQGEVPNLPSLKTRSSSPVGTSPLSAHYAQKLASPGEGGTSLISSSSDLNKLIENDIMKTIDTEDLQTPSTVGELRGNSSQGEVGGFVLIVEDDVVHSRVLQIHLEKTGLTTHVAKDGEEALEAASRLQPDLIILDVMLPKMNGFEVCEHIRAIEDLDDVPIIFLTSIDLESKILEAYDLGADDYVVKPFQPAILAAKVKKAVRRRQHHVAQTISSLKPGIIVDGRYEILYEVGRGGMGTIYLARHQRLGFTLALKAMNPERPNHEKAKLRFQREIRALAELKHPHLIRIHDCGDFGQFPYYVMDYVPGGSLYQKLQKEKILHPVEALDIAGKIASGLHCAHTSHILHRDLKTENILFTKTGEPILTDFGLVLNFTDDSKRLTKAGCVVGTPHYMSPEQLTQPNEIDGRSDVFSLGLVLYEMLTGQNPLMSLSRTEVMIKIVTEDIPSPLTTHPHLPLPAVEVCMQALQRRRSLRFSSAMAMSRACEQAIMELQEVQPAE